MSAVVVVGGGHAGVQAAASLREGGHAGRIVLVTAEPHLPYERPPLSKDFLAGEIDPSGVALRSAKFFTEKQIEVHIGAEVTSIDRGTHHVILADGSRLAYDQLILATGTRARELPLTEPDVEGVLSLRTLSDATYLVTALDAARERGSAVVCLGAGFIGLEVAAAAHKKGLATTILEVAPRVLGRSASQPLAEHITAVHRERGADLRLATGVTGVETEMDHVHGKPRVTGVVLDTGERVPCALLVVGIGAQVNDELACAAGLEVNNGIIVDQTLTTQDPAIHAVGDCANFWDASRGVRLRLESVQNATDQARHVARHILSGEPASYTAVPWFWTDQHGMKIQIAGLTAGHDTTVRIGSDEAFSVLCFRGHALLGVESVNRTIDHVAARRLLAQESNHHPTPDDARAPGFELRRWLALATSAGQPVASA